MKPVHIGCSGWMYDDWRGGLYQEGLAKKRWLERYAEVFDTVEVNSTFYRLASRDAVADWVARTPEHFVFSVKASRYLTHIKRLTDLDQGIRRFYERIEPMVEAGRLGPVLWQLPESFQRDDDRLAAAVEALPGGRHCFEFRHSSWFVPEVYELLRARDVALVIGDHPKWPHQAREMTAGWTFIRLHYGARGRRGNYSRSELEMWRDCIERWRERAEVFVYFNNDWEGFAVRNARWMQRALAAEPVPT